MVAPWYRRWITQQQYANRCRLSICQKTLLIRIGHEIKDRIQNRPPVILHWTHDMIWQRRWFGITNPFLRITEGIYYFPLFHVLESDAT